MNRFRKRNARKNITIITSIPFPIGSAASNRIISYCDGFNYNNYSTKIIIINPINQFNKDINNTSLLPSYIKYVYVGKIYFTRYKLFRHLQNLISLVYSYFYIILRLIIYNDSRFYIIYGFNPIFETIATLSFKILGVPVLKELSEHPEVMFSTIKTIPQYFLQYLYYKIIFRKYHGIISMTNPISQLLQSKGIKITNIINVNNTFRLENTKSKLHYKLPNVYYSYIGSLDQKKDGILTLIEALSIVAKSYGDIMLVIAGSGTESEVSKLLKVIDEKMVQHNITFLGQISNFDAQEIIENAKGLISTRPYSMQAEYGFPTKLVEYLMTGNPVISTTWGDSDILMINNVHLFKILSNTPDEIAERWLSVEKNYAFAKHIGLCGKERAKQLFNPITQTKKIINFINNSQEK